LVHVCAYVPQGAALVRASKESARVGGGGGSEPKAVSQNAKERAYFRTVAIAADPTTSTRVAMHLTLKRLRQVACCLLG
jgi:hypothetical protein